MWNWVIFLCLTITWAEAQNGRGPQQQDHNGHGWDIRLAVPGEPGNDYPTLGAIPRTSFSCAGKEPGYYADIETNCQAFRVCTVGSTYGFQSFLCPNGTLFNQAVFVCDWWMNVNCKNTEQLINNKNNEKFENLRLGPQLMKDIKKMLTHPMRNPYDKNIMRSNLIIMQDYKPPTGQLFPNGALLAGPERPPNNVFVPSKQIIQNFVQSNSSNFTFSASTPDPRFASYPGVSHFRSNHRDEDPAQKQQKGQYIRAGQVDNIQNLQRNDNLISNGHAGQLTQQFKSNLNYNNNHSQLSQVTYSTQATNISQRQANTVPALQPSNIRKNENRLTNRQPSPVSHSTKTPQTSKKMQTGLEKAFTESQNNQNSPLGLTRFSKEVNGRAGRELKDNLVSTISNVPTTVVTKTIRKVVHKPRAINSKSRTPIKTWVVKPTKSGRQLSDPVPYIYTKPSFTPPTASESLSDVTPYIYEIPTTFSLLVNSVESPEPTSKESYVYDRPTVSSKQTEATELENTHLYMTPTSNPTRPTFAERLNSPITSPLPTESSRYYLPPSLNVERLYLPSSQDSSILSRQYLSPIAIPQLVYFESAKLKVNPSIPSPTPIPVNEKLAFLISKGVQINALGRNLTFSDILTKEKLNVSVNDIVKDTGSILKTAMPPQYGQYRKNFIKSLNTHENEYILVKKTDSRESLTSQSPIQSAPAFAKSLGIVTPAVSLVPPDETFSYQNSNPLSTLPFYKESELPNVIERTVTIKIMIPENIAKYLFNNQSNADFDKLELLNTGSSNYLVFSNNNLVTEKKVVNNIPLSKFTKNNPQSISDSQALVYSFFTDSINVAREFRNSAQQDVISSTITPTSNHFQNLNSQQLSDITNNISQLTASQFSSNTFNNIDRSAKIATTQPTYINQIIPFTGNFKYSNEHQAQQIQRPNHNPSQLTQNEYLSAGLMMPNTQQNVISNSNIYSGQLYRWPVPEVINQIYNRPTSSKLVNSNTLQHQSTLILPLQNNINQMQQNPAVNFMESTPEVEIIKAETVNLSPTKLNLEPFKESEQQTSTETLTNLLHSGNGISAHLQDKIVGTVAHPVEQNKVITYRNNRSYYLYAKPEDTIDENISTNKQTDTVTQVMPVNSNALGSETFQLIPSVNYELEDVEEQQQILDAFQIDEFGAPRDIIKVTNTTESNNQKDTSTSSIDSSVEHAMSAKFSDRFRTSPSYSESSTYTGSPSTAGSLEKVRTAQSNFNSRLENFDNNNEIGYPKERPARQFLF